MAGRNNSPFSQPQFRIPGYTGHVHGSSEVFARTPAMAQLETQQPGKASFLSARQAASMPGSKDICTEAAVQHAGRAEPANLWPCLQTTGAQEPAKPQTSSLRLGDDRINPFVTSYSAQFDAPFESSKKIRSPLRNTALKHLGTAGLKDLYRSAYGRVGEKRLGDIMHHMKERLTGKLGNHNDNAFKLRKLFKMQDPEGSGVVEVEDFRVTTEAFGIQLDDDSLFALYHKFDPEGTGKVQYHAVMRELLDPDCYAMYVGASDPLRGLQAAAVQSVEAVVAGGMQRQFVQTGIQ